MRLAAAALLALVLAACGSQAQKPEDAAIKDVGLIVSNKYSEAWDQLYSRDRAVAPRDEYVTCESRSPVIEVPKSTKALGVTDESVGIGDGTFVDSKAVKLQLDFRGGRLVHTVHVIEEGGKWKWMFPAARYRQYKANQCATDAGSSPPPSSS